MIRFILSLLCPPRPISVTPATVRRIEEEARREEVRKTHAASWAWPVGKQCEECFIELKECNHGGTA